MRHKVNIDKQWLYDQYITQDKKAKLIAEENGVSKSIIRFYIRKFDIHKLPKPKAIKIPKWKVKPYKNINDKDYLFYHYIVLCKTQIEIAEENNIYPIAINRKLKHFSINRNDRALHANPIDKSRMYYNKQWLYEQHITLNKRPIHIAKEINTLPPNIYTYLKKYNID